MAWLSSYRQVEAVYLNPSISDHSPLCLLCGAGRPFRFLNVLASHASFLDVVREVNGCPMFKVWTRLKHVKDGLI